MKLSFCSKQVNVSSFLDLCNKTANYGFSGFEIYDAVSETEEEEDATPEKIISAVCGYYKITKEDLIGKSKKADLVKARQICAYLLCEMLSLPLVSAGNILGGRDHTTIMYARDKIEKMAELNDKIAKEIEDIQSIILKK